MLERAADARARDLRPFSGYGASADAYHPVAPHPQGMGAEATIRAALADADANTGDVDHVNAHGTSTPAGDRIEALTLRRVLGERPSVTSVKGVTGHTLGAAGAIEAAVTVLTLTRGLVPPMTNFFWSCKTDGTANEEDPGAGWRGILRDVVALCRKPLG